MPIRAFLLYGTMFNMKKLIVANWKMNPKTLREARTLFSSIKKTGSKLHNVQTVVCTPYPYLADLQKTVSGHRVVLGAQNVFSELEGAYTGEVSILNLKSVGVKYVILGHSERRKAGETNEDVSARVKVSLKAGINIIVCVGEETRDENAEYLHYLRTELKESLYGMSSSSVKKLIIAYEPIWAIGKNANKADTPTEAVESILFLRKVLTEIFNKKIAMDVPIIYGGSVNPKNADSFIKENEINGLLVGRASLDGLSFSKILKKADKN